MYPMHKEYEYASYYALKSFDRRAFYGACYGNAPSMKIAIDFFSMYNMGGEL